MKRTAAILALLAGVASLTACRGDDPAAEYVQYMRQDAPASMSTLTDDEIVEGGLAACDLMDNNDWQDVADRWAQSRIAGETVLDSQTLAATVVNAGFTLCPEHRGWTE